MEEVMNEGNLSESRLEIQMALGNFLAHIKYTITLMSTIVVLAVGLYAFALDHSGQDHSALLPALHHVCFLTGTAFLLLLPLAYYSEKICRRYYLIYASNYIYYARCHIVHSTIEHTWVKDLFLNQGLDKESILSDKAVDHFIEGKKSKDPNSWVYYRRFLRSYILIGITGALYFYYEFGSGVLFGTTGT